MSTRVNGGAFGGIAAFWMLLAGCSTRTVTVPDSTTDQGSVTVGETNASLSGNDGSSVSFPTLDPGTADLTLSYLNAEGVLIGRFRSAVTPLISQDPGASASTLFSLCTSVAESLNSVNPSELLKVAQGVPDSTLGDLFVTERRLVSDALVACGAGDTVAMDHALHNLKNAGALIDQRLREIKP